MEDESFRQHCHVHSRRTCLARRFRKINSVGRTILAGAGLSLFIEITQLFFYERASDIDDIILNTAGAASGALIFFGCRRLFSKKAK